MTVLTVSCVDIGFVLVKFIRGVIVGSNPPPCFIQGGWDTVSESPL